MLDSYENKGKRGLRQLKTFLELDRWRRARWTVLTVLTRLTDDASTLTRIA